MQGQSEGQPTPRPEAAFSAVELKDDLSRSISTSTLPAALDGDQLGKAIGACDNVIFKADTGSGKSTMGPMVILESLLRDNPNARIAVTQPTRLATKSVAEYVGHILGEQGAEYVDYRFKDKSINKPESRIQFSVVGSLLKEAVNDSSLSNYDAVFLDEFHLRTIDMDILLPLIQIAQEKRAGTDRPLKIIVASATLDADAATEIFGDDVERVHIEGRSYEVAKNYVAEDKPIKPDQVMKAAADKTTELLNDKSKTGDLLIFMPGASEIAETERQIRANGIDSDIEIVTIMGGDRDGDPYQKINNNPENKRRIYISTNVAETSITIPGIKMVIDSGLMKSSVYDPNTRFSTLQTTAHTQSNWIQRAGRAGRTENGEAYALFTRSQFEAREKQEVAEILRSDLTPQILRMKAAGIKDVFNFNYIDRPTDEVLNQGIETLQRLGALNKEGEITQLGQMMSELDIDPHFARIIVEARQRNCMESIALLISLMNTKESVFSLDFKNKEKLAEKYPEYVDSDSDFITFLKVWNEFIKDYAADPKNETNWEDKWKNKGINLNVLQKIARESGGLRRELGIPGGRNSDKQVEIDSQREAIDMSLASGLIPNQLVSDKFGFRYVTGSSAGIDIDRFSGLYGQGLSEILSGKVHSTKKAEGSTRARALLNMKFDKEKLLEAFPYLREFIKSEIVNKIEEITPTELKPENESEVSETQTEAQGTETTPENQPLQTEVAHEMDHIETSVATNPSEQTREHTLTFIEKIKNNWHKLTDKVKEMYIKFKNSIKGIFKTKINS